MIERFAAAVCADPSSFCFDDVRALIADLVVCRNVLDHALTVASARADELAAVLALMTGMVFTDTNRGAYGLLTWLLLGAAGRVPVRQRVEAT